MSALEEVDVEEQLQNQDDSDTPVIKINTEVSDEKKEPKFEVGDIVADTVNFDPQGPIPPVYVVKEIREGGKYLIEQQNLEGDEIPPPYEVNEDDLKPVSPTSPSGPFDTPEKSQELVENKEDENLTEITSDETDSEDDDSDDEDDFKKLESDISRDYLLSFHPELKQINFKPSNFMIWFFVPNHIEPSLTMVAVLGFIFSNNIILY